MTASNRRSSALACSTQVRPWGFIKRVEPLSDQSSRISHDDFSEVERETYPLQQYGYEKTHVSRWTASRISMPLLEPVLGQHSPRVSVCPLDLQRHAEMPFRLRINATALTLLPQHPQQLPYVKSLQRLLHALHVHANHDFVESQRLEFLSLERRQTARQELQELRVNLLLVGRRQLQQVRAFSSSVTSSA
jgi:hypothetical protein